MFWAHHIFNNSNKEWRDCMILAWQIYFCYQWMKRGPVKFYYRKKDGSIRCAFGRLKDIQNNKMPINYSINWDTFNYWDIEKRAWRCFKVENFITMARSWQVNKPKKK